MTTARTVDADRQPRSILFDVMVSGLVAAVSFPPVFGPRGWHIAVGFAMALALLARRRWPLSVMAVVSGLALVQVLLFTKFTGPMSYDVAVLIAMYSVVKYGSALWHGFLAAAPVLAGIVIVNLQWIAHLPESENRLTAMVTGGVYLTAVATAIWLTGYVIRTRRQTMAALEERAATAERERDHLAAIAVADERASIARDLHDVVAHSMAVMIVQADGASYAMDGDPDQARVAIKQVAATGRDALEDMRRLVGVLRGGVEAGPGDPDEPVDRRRINLHELSTLVQRARAAGLTVTFDEQGVRDEMPAAVELTVFRIAQEALTNVLRHAGPATRVDLRLRHRAKLTEIEVLDNGMGALAGISSLSAGGHGLVGMRERVGVHAGTLTAGPRSGGGWRVAVTLPWM